MLGQLVVGPSSSTTTATLYGSSVVVTKPFQWDPLGRVKWGWRKGGFWVKGSLNSSHNKQNHYAVLGLSRSASSSDIKKAYRLLARKWHPDVSKDSRAGEVFKSIHLAYQVLSNEATRVQYDRVLKSDEYATESIRRNIYYDSKFEDEIRIYKWSDLRKKMRRDGYQQRYTDGGENFSFYTESDEETEDDISTEERGSFIQVLQSVFLTLILTRTIGCQLALMFNSLTALFDRKLDGGYKLGYFVAWALGGRGGLLLSLCLSFASWACGKNSSSMVSLVVVAMWIGSNILSYTPLPQGAVLALLYMSFKLQVDLS